MAVELEWSSGDRVRLKWGAVVVVATVRGGKLTETFDSRGVPSRAPAMTYLVTLDDEAPVIGRPGKMRVIDGGLILGAAPG